MSSQPKSSGPPTPWTTPNGIYANYDLHCHCGAIRYNMKISPPLYEEECQGREQCVAIECDCSTCERNGLWAVHPLAKDVTFTKGLEDRKEYFTGQKKNPYWFCGKCGSVVGMDLTQLMKEVFHVEPRYTVNLRMLKDFDRKKLKVREGTGMSKMPPQYSID